MTYPTGSIDQLGIRIPHGWGRTWPKALRQSGERPAIVTFIGASGTEGYFSTNHLRRGWAGLVAGKLQSTYGHGGDGFLGVAQAPHAGAAPFDLRDSGNSDWFHDPNWAMAGLAYTPVGEAWIEWPDYNGSDITVLYEPSIVFGDFDVHVDGQLAQTVSGWAGGRQPAAPVSTKILGSYGAGPHRIRITNHEDSAGQSILGVHAANPTGVRPIRIAHTGWQTSNMFNEAFDNAAVPPNTVGLWSVEKMSELVGDGPNDLIIYVLGTNDWYFGVDPQTVAENMRKILDYARTNRDDVDIVFMINHPGWNGATGPYTDLIDVLYGVANEYDAATVDMWAKSGFNSDIGSLLDDGLHPTDMGMEWIAESVNALVCDTCVRGTWDYTPTKPKQPIGSWLQLEAGLGGYAFTDDLSGYAWEDLDVMFYGKTLDWSDGADRHVVGVWDSGEMSWVLGYNGSGAPTFSVGDDDGSVTYSTVTADNQFVRAADSLGATFRAERSTNDTNNVQFWDAPQWRKNGESKSVIPGQRPPITTGPLRVGSTSDGYFFGQIWRVEVRNNGVLVANPDFTRHTEGTTEFRDSCGNVWKLANGAHFETGGNPGRLGISNARVPVMSDNVGLVVHHDLVPDNASVDVSVPGNILFAALAGMPWSGGITEDAAVISAVTPSPAMSTDLMLSTSSDMSGATLVDTKNSDADGWLRFELSGLSADTRYWYRVHPDNTPLIDNEIGTFKTHPTVGDPHSFAFSVSADAGQGTLNPYQTSQGGGMSGSPAWDTIKAALPTDSLFFGMYGDLHYRDLGTPTQPLAESVAEYQKLYTDVLNAPHQSQFWRDNPISFMFDNHDSQEAGFSNDTESHTSPGVDPTYRLCVPSYPVSEGKLWQEWQIGRVQFIVTDNRSHRTASPGGGAGGTLLGIEQRNWFLNLLATTTSELIIWFTPDPYTAEVTNLGGWDIANYERTLIAQAVYDNNLEDRLLAVSGNPHYTAYHNGGANRNFHGHFREAMICGMDVSGNHGKLQYWVDCSPAFARHLWGAINVIDDGSQIEVAIDMYNEDHQWGRSRFFYPPVDTYYNNGSYEYVVPAGVTQVSFDIRGAKGGDGDMRGEPVPENVSGAGYYQTYGYGGKGARVQGTLAVTPGDTLYLFVGQHGRAGDTSLGSQYGGGAGGGDNGLSQTASNGRGGGAATDIRLNGTSLAHRVAVAGGGGGGTVGRQGGGGGYPAGEDGEGFGPNGGGTQTEDGAGGTQPDGIGGQDSTTLQFGWIGGGGGGGGYFGGGGGFAHVNLGSRGAGGGGSSWTDSTLVTNVTHTNDENPAPGTALITAL